MIGVAPGSADYPDLLPVGFFNISDYQIFGYKSYNLSGVTIMPELKEIVDSIMALPLDKKAYLSR